LQNPNDPKPNPGEEEKINSELVSVKLKNGATVSLQVFYKAR